MHVMGVIGDHQRYIQLLSQGDQALIDLGQLGNVLVTLNLEEITVAEPLLVPTGRLGRSIIVAVGDQAWNLGGRTGGKDNQALAKLLKDLFIDAGAVVKSVHMGLGDQLHQVSVPGVVPGQQDQMVGAALGGVLVEAAVVGYVNFTADDGFDANFPARRVEVDHPVEGAVVSDGQGVHPQLFRAGHQVGNTADAVQHAVLGVNVKVREH